MGKNRYKVIDSKKGHWFVNDTWIVFDTLIKRNRGYFVSKIEAEKHKKYLLTHREANKIKKVV